MTCTPRGAVVALEGVHPLRRRPSPLGSGSTRRSARARRGRRRSRSRNAGHRCPAAPRRPGPGHRPGGSPLRATPPRRSSGVTPSRMPAKRSGNCATIPSWRASASDHDLGEDVVERLDVGRPVPLIRATASSFVSLRWSASRSRTSFSGQFGLAPARKAAISSMLAVQRASCVANARLVAGLGGRDEVDGDHDVLLEQLGQLVAGGLAVVAGDRRRRCPPGSSAGGRRRRRHRACPRRRRRCTPGSRSRDRTTACGARAEPVLGKSPWNHLVWTGRHGRRGRLTGLGLPSKSNVRYLYTAPSGCQVFH